MKNSVVIFNGTQQHTFTGSKKCIVCLNPGSNVVSIKNLEELGGVSQSYVDAVDSGQINILEEGVVKAETKDKGEGAKNPSDDTIILNVSEMGAREAVSVISSETDVDIIRGYLNTEMSSENRPTVIKACEAAIESLTDDSAA